LVASDPKKLIWSSNGSHTDHALKMKKQKKTYNIQEGMIFNKDYYGKSHRLLVVNNDGVLQFKVDNQIFPTLTAAARHVCGDATRQISGPIFWGIQSTDSKS
jgi:hypothetical protein